jgi:UDP-N-acetyl-D-glucosamine dehydrogenase
LASVERLQASLGGDLRSRRILLMGVAYRPDIGDTRFSPSQVFFEELQRRGAEVVVQDPIVCEWQELRMFVSAKLPLAADVDAVVFAVPHKAYRSLDLVNWLGTAKPIVLDANAVLTSAQRQAVINAGCAFFAIGEG